MTQHKHIFTVRLSAAQYRILEKLERKLNIDKTNVIRLAITRMAESENFLQFANETNKDKETGPHRRF